MTGVCGVLGQSEHEFNWMIDDLQWTGRENAAVHIDANVALGSVSHPGSDREQPAPVGDDVLVWVWGDVWGFHGPGQYRSYREDDAKTVAQFCARWYDKYGIEFATRLNGNFTAVIYEQDTEQVHLVTDRLGTHSVYYTQPDPRTVVFSSQIQSLPVHPAVDTTFDVDYLSEYFMLGAVGGVQTPFKGIHELSPSSVMTVDLETGTVESERYWRPEYDPLDRPFSYFVDQFVEAFEAVLNDRLDPEQTYGLLLSGGSDSRAILAGVDSDIDLRTYHVAGWMSREARTAEKVALAADREFQLLSRDFGSHERMLETTPRMMNFQGRFNEAHISEFADQLQDEVDVLISGHGADTLFRDHAFPLPQVELGSLGKFESPTVEETESIEEFITRREKRAPEYLESSSSLTDILRRNITTGSGVTHHGVPYRSVDELVFFDDFYPFSNKSDFFYPALNGMMPHWSPFFDNRLIDIALRLPVEYRTRRNLIDATTIALDDTLGTIPHAGTGVPLTESFPLGFVRGLVNQFVWKHLSGDQPPEAHLSHGPWTNKDGLIRSHEFVGEKLRMKEDLIDALPFLNREGVYQCYDEHLNGADNSFELYTLLTFLYMPVVETMATNNQLGRQSVRPQ